MTEVSNPSEAGRLSPRDAGRKRAKAWAGSAAAIAILVGGAVVVPHLIGVSAGHAAAAGPPPPSVSVSTPLQRNLDTRLEFLGQFSPMNQVELRAQVGGTLTQIRFKDGEIVHKGDVLFEIDPVPYEIKLSQATAGLEAATARFDLASHELERAQQLKSTDAGSTENVEQRAAEKAGAQAAVDGAKATVRDARFDLDRCRIVAPFTGRIGTHQVSVGNLVAGSRAGGAPTTLLATLVSLDSIYLNFDMSEADYMTFTRQREKAHGPIADKVDVGLVDETVYSRQGTMTFVDNSLDRSSGTIHARATVPNTDALLTPGGFARVRLAMSAPAAVLLVPDAAVLPDQSDHIVLTIGPNDVVTPKVVTLGDLRGGLRVIRSGLAPTDKVIIDGIPTAAPGSKVAPHAGTIQFGSDQAQG